MLKRFASEIKFDPLGEQAVILSVSESFRTAAHSYMIRLSRLLARKPFPGFRECVPGNGSLCVYFDVLEILSLRQPTHPPFQAVCEWLMERVASLSSESENGAQPTRTVLISVCYCPQCGPDLPEVAKHAGMEAAEAARLHASQQYIVSMIGFMPGFPYLSGLPERLRIPRRKTPRRAVQAGSVAIAGDQTGIYPQSSPGGWRLIGRTSVRLFQPDTNPPSFLETGDAVTFIPVKHEEMGWEME